jgi:energy-coupling factor transporter ATP-binding protein EcfA2
VVNGTIYHDLGTSTRQMVKIDANGWDVGHFQVYFKRHTDMKALPSPLRGGAIMDLLQFFPPLPQADQCLALCWLIASFFSNIERAFLLLEGGPGMGKTTLSKILKSFIDPDVNGAISYNDKVSEVAQILDHHYIPHFDNVTAISRKVSDLICTSYSSGSYTKKKNYTDDGDHVFELSGNAIFTAVTLLKPKGDFLDRCYKIVMKEASNAYRSKQQFTESFNAMAPALYGAVLDTVSATMRKVKEMPTVGRFRTVDFDRYASAAAEVMGFGADFFWKARGYSESIKLCSIVNNTPLIEALTNFLKSHNYFYSGYMKKLVQELPQYTKEPDQLPKQPNVLARRIGEIDTELRLAGVVVEKKYNDNSGALYEITFSEQQPSVTGTPAENVMEAVINSPPVEPDDLDQLITQVIEKHASDLQQSELKIGDDDNDEQNPFLNFYKNDELQ